VNRRLFLGAQPFEPLAAVLRDLQPIECTLSGYRDSLLIELQPTNGAHSLDLADVSVNWRAPLSGMERASNSDELLSIAAGEIRAVSGFDRVMVYHFRRRLAWQGTRRRR
jgi:light-regulated signal transduction histidine kinase (bacteriophytochrome)